MAPTVQDGDVLLISSGHERIEDGRVYVIRWGDELRTKRLFKAAEAGRMAVRSDNPDKTRFPDETVSTESDEFAVIARVEWRGGWI